MRFLNRFFQSQSPRDDRVSRVRSEFAFLTRNLGYIVSESTYQSEWSDTPRPLLLYRNDAAGRQIDVEPLANEDTLELYVRLLLNGEPVSWRDENSYVSLEDIQIHTDGSLNCSRFGDSFDDRLRVAVELLHSNADMLNGTSWFSRDVIEDVRDADFKKRLNLSRPRGTSNQQNRREFEFLCSEFGFSIMSDTDDLAPYGEPWEDVLTFERDDVVIELGYYGGRDRTFQVKYNQHAISGRGKGWNYPDEIRKSIVKNLRKRLTKRFRTQDSAT